MLLCGLRLYGQVPAADSIARKAADGLEAVKTDTTLAVQVDSLIRKSSGKPKFYPNPKRALRWSLLTPGLGGGQIYNRDYWKLPFVYAAYGASVYFIFLNIDRYGTMVDHYKSFYFLSDPSDKNTYGKLNPDVKTVQVYIKSQNRYADLDINQVKRFKDTYRRWRDWSFFALAATYSLAAIEANVAAHLKTFDLSDDLSMRVQPSFVQPQLATPAPGIRLVLLLK
ncbi:hypothetical protein GCM10023091_43150 [Ravibacter arvi]|uniref:DUF5683 domain-containing protein n=2 Tax=Ravibacter arvi TaxID=2051041 RepID=A0ABP8MB60_9BACT